MYSVGPLIIHLSPGVLCTFLPDRGGGGREGWEGGEGERREGGGGKGGKGGREGGSGRRDIIIPLQKVKGHPHTKPLK